MAYISRISEAIEVGADMAAYFFVEGRYPGADNLGEALQRRYGGEHQFTQRVIDALLNRVQQAVDAGDILENQGFISRQSIPRAGSRGDTAGTGPLESAYRYVTSVTVGVDDQERTITVVVNSASNLTYDELKEAAIRQSLSIPVPGFGSQVFADLASREGAEFTVDVWTIFRAT